MHWLQHKTFPLEKLFETAEWKVVILWAKKMLHETPEFKNMYLWNSKYHTERIVELKGCNLPKYDLPHDKTNKMTYVSSEDGSIWSESLLSANG